MDFGLGEDIDALRETVRKFAQEEIAPKSAEVDRSNDFPMELWEMMGNLGLGGDGGLGALAGLLPGKGEGTGRPGKPKPKPGYQQQSGVGGAQGKPQQALGKARRWTFGHGQMDISKWKGKGTNGQVIQTFGQPDAHEPWGQGGGAWTYKKMKITDAAGKSHRSITFYMQNGMVVDVKLPAVGGAKPKN